ncbi:hypothetical protein LTS10_011102 [Elasticomyces elasticus]|nr:hypothetical protein LTS10_011102 [Elasticomyces elasticus]
MASMRTSAQLLTPAPSDGEEAINPAVASDDGKIGITRDPANDPCRFAGTLATREPIFNKYLLQYGIAYNSQSSIRADVRLIYFAHVKCLTQVALAPETVACQTLNQGTSLGKAITVSASSP